VGLGNKIGEHGASADMREQSARRSDKVAELGIEVEALREGHVMSFYFASNLKGAAA